MSPLQQKDRTRALVGTIIFHALLLVTVLFLSLTTPLPLPGEEGVEVNLGYSDQGMGDIQPLEAAAASPQAASPQQSPDEEMITQETEEAPAIKETPRKPEPKPVENKPRTEPEPKKVEPEQPKVDPRALYPGRQTGTSSGGSQGETGQPGDQGKPGGTPDGKGYDGQGGAGDGVSFSLDGRKANSLPKPDPRFSESGTVVVTIWVDRSGKVTRAVPGARGTNTPSATLRRLAEEAALRARFNEKPDGPEEQRGTITYHFLIRN
ncbi:MAG TPA: TonB family protein [Bacteroidales bacterium]|nr:TonB family protein [Bacteroidales bacterium]